MVTLTDRISTSSPSSIYSESSNGVDSKGRPDFSRSNTSNSFLDYYTSPLPDAHAKKLAASQSKRQSSHVRQLSSGSESSDSQYSSFSGPEEAATAPPVPPSRRKKGSKGAGDRRRLHIVEMQSMSEDRRVPSTVSDTGHDKDPHSRNSVRVRKDTQDRSHGLALVAPPDATPSSYRNLTAASPPLATLQSLKSWDLSPSSHQRSSSEATIMNERADTAGNVSPQLPPLDFIEKPRQRTYSSYPATDNLASMATKSASSSAITTPEIGQEKRISVPVAPPVIVQVTTSSPTKSQSPSKKHAHVHSTPSPSNQPPRLVTSRTDYLDYQPGIHATAGPLPPPPEPSSLLPIPTTFSQPPPRPPRLRSPSPNTKNDLTAVKHALQLPPSVTAKLSTPSSSPDKEVISPTAEDTSPAQTHKREAAFSPSVFLQQKPPSSPVQSTKSSPDKTSTLVDTHLSDLGGSSELKGIDDRSDTSPIASNKSCNEDSLRSQGRSNESRAELLPSLSRHDRRSEEGPAHSPVSPIISPSILERMPSPPPKSLRHITPKSTLKRDATLPKIPSHAPSVRTTFSDLHSTYTSSPPHSPKLRLEHRRIISPNPQAMYFADVLSKKSCLERSVGYAQKINELYLYDTGLGDWLSDVKSRGRSQEHLPSRAPLSPISQNRSLSLHRQPSRSSLMSGVSEATFPTRPDASVATDLTKMPSRDLSLPTALPLVPYPSLAPAQQRALSSRSSVLSVAASARTPAYPTNKAAAFFASLGRTSSTKKEKIIIGGSPSPTNPPKVLTKALKPPMQIANPPPVPGGPRALPGRQPRSQTIMISAPLNTNDNRNSTITRRPSLFSPPSSEKQETDLAFSEQVDKLQDLLPHVDRNILAGYLKRSGHDMLAIGQYLEDEKNGTVKAY